MWIRGINGTSTTGLTAGDHSVTVVDGNGCNKMYEFTIEDITSSVSNAAWENQVSVFPNPAVDVLTIQLPLDITTIEKIEYYNVNGQLIETIDVDINKT